jgi:hypothetical protein
MIVAEVLSHGTPMQTEMMVGVEEEANIRGEQAGDRLALSPSPPSDSGLCLLVSQLSHTLFKLANRQ